MTSVCPPDDFGLAARVSQSGRSPIRACGFRATSRCDLRGRPIYDFWTMPWQAKVADNHGSDRRARVTSSNEPAARGESACGGFHARQPVEATSTDPDVLRAALIREATERRRAECLAGMQAEVVQLAIDLLVQQPDIEEFFGALTKTMVEEGESHACGVWLIDDSGRRSERWMADGKDRLFKARDDDPEEGTSCPPGTVPWGDRGDHLFAHTAGWTQTVEYTGDDPRLPESLRAFSRDN